MAKIGSNCVVCAEAILTGSVTVGNGTIIHPRAEIDATNGPIEIGENNLIEENALIKNTSGELLKIGNNNIFEVGCQVEARSIGDNNVVEAKAFVGPKISLLNGCVIGAKCTVLNQDCICENGVIFGSGHDRYVTSERPLPQTSQLDFLRKLLPNFHHLKS